MEGEIELRGLKPGTYHVNDYAQAKDLSVVEAAQARAPS